MQEYKTLKDFSKILSLFSDLKLEEISVAEVSRALGIIPSKVSRMFRTLECEGFFEKNSETGKYRLGIAFFELGVIYAFHLPLRKIIRPHIEQMAKIFNVTSSWAVFRNNKIIILDRIQNLNIDMLSYRIGLSLPIHSTSVGKVLLAYLSEEEQDRILRSINLTKFTDATMVEPKLIKENLKLVRERGYSTDEGETHEDLNCIGVPVRNAAGEVIAAISLMDEKSRTSREEMIQFVDKLKERGIFISSQLGYRF